MLLVLQIGVPLLVFTLLEWCGRPGAPLPESLAHLLDAAVIGFLLLGMFGLPGSLLFAFAALFAKQSRAELIRLGLAGALGSAFSFATASAYTQVARARVPRELFSSPRDMR